MTRLVTPRLSKSALRKSLRKSIGKMSLGSLNWLGFLLDIVTQMSLCNVTNWTDFEKTFRSSSGPINVPGNGKPSHVTPSAQPSTICQGVIQSGEDWANCKLGTPDFTRKGG
jgi:hypothetical protein